MADIYRKSSIEKLSNPEQLDKAIRITSPLTWLALLGGLLIVAATVVWSIIGTLPETKNVTGIITSSQNIQTIFTDVTGTMDSICVSEGTIIDIGTELACVKTAEGDTVTIYSDCKGIVSTVLTEVDSMVFTGQEIMRITPDSMKQAVIFYIPVALAQELKTGMKVLITPAYLDSQKYGHMEAVIDDIADYPASNSNMALILGNDNLLINQFVANGPVVTVICKLVQDDSTLSGFYWSNENGKNVAIQNGTLITGNIVVREDAPISRLFSIFRKE